MVSPKGFQDSRTQIMLCLKPAITGKLRMYGNRLEYESDFFGKILMDKKGRP